MKTNQPSRVSTPIEMTGLACGNAPRTSLFFQFADQSKSYLGLRFLGHETLECFAVLGTVVSRSTSLRGVRKCGQLNKPLKHLPWKTSPRQRVFWGQPYRPFKKMTWGLKPRCVVVPPRSKDTGLPSSRSFWLRKIHSSDRTSVGQPVLPGSVGVFNN